MLSIDRRNDWFFKKKKNDFESKSKPFILQHVLNATSSKSIHIFRICREKKWL